MTTTMSASGAFGVSNGLHGGNGGGTVKHGLSNLRIFLLECVPSVGSGGGGTGDNVSPTSVVTDCSVATPSSSQYESASYQKLQTPTGSDVEAGHRGGTGTRTPSKSSEDGEGGGTGTPRTSVNSVSYDGSSHLSVLVQKHGSVWPRVLPYCLANALLTVLVIFLRDAWGVDVTIQSNLHTFMSLILGVLIVRHADAVYNRFVSARSHLEDLFRCSREIVHFAVVLTGGDKSDGARKWRMEVAYGTILLLRVTVAALEYQHSRKNTWDVDDLEGGALRDVRHGLFLLPEHQTPTHKEMPKRSSSIFESFHRRISGEGAKQRMGRARASRRGGFRMSAASVSAASNSIRWAHGPRTLRDENFRAPTSLTYRLRASVVSGRRCACSSGDDDDAHAAASAEASNPSGVTAATAAAPNHPATPTMNNRHFPQSLPGGIVRPLLHVNQEREILNFICQYAKSYEDLRSLLTTPYPFPLLQMTRTFTFFWVYSIPLALAREIQHPLQVVLIVFVITFAFVGLTVVSMELDDPFADHPNNIDDLTLAQMVFEDIYMAIWRADGMDEALRLRERILDRKSGGTPLEHYRRDSVGMYRSSGVVGMGLRSVPLPRVGAPVEDGGGGGGGCGASVGSDAAGGGSCGGENFGMLCNGDIQLSHSLRTCSIDTHDDNASRGSLGYGHVVA